MRCFQFGSIMNNVAMNIYVKAFCAHLFSFLLGKYLRVELLGHRVGKRFTL